MWSFQAMALLTAPSRRCPLGLFRASMLPQFLPVHGCLSARPCPSRRHREAGLSLTWLVLELILYLLDATGDPARPQAPLLACCFPGPLFLPVQHPEPRPPNYGSISCLQPLERAHGPTHNLVPPARGRDLKSASGDTSAAILWVPGVAS